MPRRKAILVLALAASLAGSQSALADDEVFTRSGFHLSLGGNYAWDLVLGEDLGRQLMTDPLDVTGSWGLNLRGGYRWNRYLSTELQVEHQISFGIFNDKFITGTANAKFIFPFEYLQPFAIFGIGASYAKLVDDTDLALRFGGGLDYALGRHWAVNLEVTYVKLFAKGVVDNDDLQSMAPVGTVLTADRLDFLSLNVGATYRF